MSHSHNRRTPHRWNPHRTVSARLPENRRANRALDTRSPPAAFRTTTVIVVANPCLFTTIAFTPLAVKPHTPSQLRRALFPAGFVALFLTSSAFAADSASKVSFLNEIMPLLAKAGCSSGGCHAKPEGQNNFKLSIFGYDPKADHREIAADGRGRRLSFAAPQQSLLLLKATAAIPHEGGARWTVDSETYRTVLTWIRQGAPFDPPDGPRLQHIAVEPRNPQLAPTQDAQLKVTATYTDGAKRDVTNLALFTSNDKDLATVSDHGLLSASERRGEAVVVVNYMGAVDVVRPVVPPAKRLQQRDFAPFPVHNHLDSLVHQRLEKIGVLPSGTCSDAEFLRRSALDTIGRLPTTEEARSFLADTAADKRLRWIDTLLADPAYADHWAVKWGDLIRPNPSRVGVKPVFLLDQWLRDAFARNMPYDAMARALLTAQGSSHQLGPVALIRDKRDPLDASSFVSQIFLGVRLECARCHHHPSEKWSQEDHQQLAACFSKLRSRGQGISAPISGEAELWWYDSSARGLLHPDTSAPITPKAPDGPEFPLRAGIDPRTDLLDWMVRPDNPFFARAVVNRVWGEFFGKGIVDPVDDFRASNPPSNPELLDWLAADFIAHRFDLKHLMRTMLASAAYQRSSLPNASNLDDQRNFARSLRRRLPAEVLLDAVCDLTGVRESLAGLPPDARAAQAWNHKLPSEFMDAFGRPNASLECPCERERKPTVVQSLHLMHASALQTKLASPTGRAARWAASKQEPQDLVNDIYLAAFARHPTAEETAAASAHLAAPAADSPARKEAVQDLVWALINTAEFVFNH